MYCRSSSTGGTIPGAPRVEDIKFSFLPRLADHLKGGWIAWIGRRKCKSLHLELARRRVRRSLHLGSPQRSRTSECLLFFALGLERC